MTNAELQKQIYDLKAKIKLLVNSGCEDNIPKKMRDIRRKAIEKYYGNWSYFRDTDIQICPKSKEWGDLDYLKFGMERLINIIYKHGRDISNSQKTISSAVECESDLKEYAEIADFVVDTMVGKIKELRDRHGIENRTQGSVNNKYA